MAEKTKQGVLLKAYRGLIYGGSFLSPFFLLIIRLYWGALFASAGFGKWMNLYEVAQKFERWHIPIPFFSAALVGTVELLGGISLFLGLFSRFFALLLTIIMITALSTAHKEAASQIFVKPSLVTKEEPFLYLFTTLTMLCFGPGLFSIDYWLEKRAYKKFNQ